MKLSEVESQPKKYKVISTAKKAEVTTTAKHPAGAGKKKIVPEHMVKHLLKKGMIEK
jgi:hypothetical protein